MHLASFPGSCAGEEEKEPGTHCSRMRQVPLVTCILLRYTKFYSQFLFTSWMAALHGYTRCGTHTSGIRVENKIVLTVTVCIASFEVIGELQRERLRHAHTAAFSWNGRMRGQLLQAKSWVPLSLPHHCLQRAWSVASIFYTGEVGVHCAG